MVQLQAYLEAKVRQDAGTHIVQSDFHRIKRLPPYVFEQVNQLKAQARARGEDIIDFGMGNPDMPTPDHIVEKLCETARDPRSNRYSASRGIKGLRKAHVAYYKRRFGVTLDPDREVIAALGSKEGFANLAQAITAPGDVVLVPNPAYPIHAFGFILAGAAIRHVPATSPETYLSGLSRAARHSVPSPVALVVNYPSNPTAQVVGLDFYKEIVKFAKKHEIWVLSDLAYADIYFGDVPPPSILEVDGAKDIAIEFQSLSKTYAMPGWRMGFAAGNEKLIGALARFKSYLDYGAYTPIQVAAAAALNGPQSVADEIRAIYKSRRDVLVKSMAASGWEIPAPAASMFAWAPVPEKYKSLGSMEFAKDLLIHAKVAVSPGIGFGEYGEGYVRVALVENEHRIRQAARNVKKFLQAGTNMAPTDDTPATKKLTSAK
jgi:alanine-synthesizing transaminase